MKEKENEIEQRQTEWSSHNVPLLPERASIIDKRRKISVMRCEIQQNVNK